MYSKDDVIELLNNLISDLIDSRDDYFDDYRNNSDKFKSHGVRVGYSRSLDVVRNYRECVQEEW